VAEVVAADDDATLEAAVERLTRDAKYRLRLAARAQQVGDRDFSAAGAAAVFQNALRGAQSS
jgi:hypothetical protein